MVSFTMMRSFTGKRNEVSRFLCFPVRLLCKEVQIKEVPIIDLNRDLKERFDERFFKSYIFFDKYPVKIFI